MGLLDKITGKEEFDIEEPQFESPAEELEKLQTPAASEDTNGQVEEMGVIAEGTTIHGDIRAKGHLAVIGVVEGDVKISGNLMLRGTIKGNIECNNMVIDSTCDFLSIIAHGSVSIKEDRVVNTDICCKHLSVLGTVNGDINASGNVGLAKSSKINGNINAAVLAVEPGAKIQGMVTVK